MNETYLLTNSLKIFFGNNSNVDLISFSKQFDKNTLKKIYRNKIKLFHPDRAKLLNIPEKKLNILFKKYNEAFEFLYNYSKSKKINSYNFHSKYSHNPFSDLNPKYNKKKNHKHFYKGQSPKHELKFAQYLYYKGIIDWDTLLSALNWQIKKRPRIGEIGVHFDFFNKNDILNIIKNKNIFEKFGETSLKMGLIDNYKLFVLLGKQKSLNYPIGRFFLENNIFSKQKLFRFLENQKEYNYQMKIIKG